MVLKDQTQKNLYLSYLFVTLIMALIQFFLYVNMDLATGEVPDWVVVVTGIISLVLGPSLYGGIFSVTISAHYEKEASIQILLKEMFPNYWKMFKLYLCIFLVIIPASLIVVFVPVLLAFFPPLSILAVILLSIGLVFLIMHLYIQCSILVLKDGLRSWQSIKHAFLSLKQAFKKILITLLIAFGVNIALSMILLLAGILLMLPISILFGFSETNPIMWFFISLVAQLAITFPLLCALSIYVKRYKEKIEPELNPAVTTETA